VVAGENATLLEFLNDEKSGFRPVGHRHRNGSVERDDRGRNHLGQTAVEVGDLSPVGICRSWCGGVAGRDRSLELIRTWSPQANCSVEHGSRFADRGNVP